VKVRLFLITTRAASAGSNLHCTVYWIHAVSSSNVHIHCDSSKLGAEYSVTLAKLVHPFTVFIHWHFVCLLPNSQIIHADTTNSDYLSLSTASERLHHNLPHQILGYIFRSIPPILTLNLKTVLRAHVDAFLFCKMPPKVNVFNCSANACRLHDYNCSLHYV